MKPSTSLTVFIRNLSPKIHPVEGHGTYVATVQSYPTVDLSIHFENLVDIETFAFKLLSEVRRMERNGRS